MNAAINTPSERLSRPAGPVLDFDPLQGRDARPRLECGLAPGISEFVEVAHAHTLRWAVESGLVQGEGKKFEHFRGARFTWLAARSYPTVNQEQLELISDWITFLFFYDDMCDTQESTEVDYLEKLVAAENRLIAIGHGEELNEDDSPLNAALANIRERVVAQGADAWLGRLGYHIQEYIEGCRWERHIRMQGRVPSLATYSKLRLLISAVYPCFDFAGLCIDGSHTKFADNIHVQQLEVMANNYICWVNDIYGVDKEIGEDTTSNIVIVLANEFNLSWDEALDRAIKMCNAELEAFTALEEAMCQFSDAEGCAYIEALKTWMRGNLDWYSETVRYGISDGETLSRCWSAWTGWEKSTEAA